MTADDDEASPSGQDETSDRKGWMPPPGPDADQTKAGGNGENHNGNGSVPRPLSLAAFLAASKPPVFLVEPMIQRSYLYTLTALTFHGKTTLLILLAICVAIGKAFAGCHTRQGRVVYFAGENPDDVAQKFLVACDYWGLDPAQLPITIVPGAFDLAADMDEAIACAEADGPVVLCIVDTSAAYRFDESEDDNQTSKQWGQWLRQFLRMKGNPATIVAAHPIKHARAKADLLPRGGGGFLNEIDGNLSSGPISRTGPPNFIGPAGYAAPNCCRSASTCAKSSTRYGHSMTEGRFRPPSRHHRRFRSVKPHRGPTRI